MEQFGPYRLEELIGRGGMGEVHRAVDTRKDRTVAVKRLIGPHADDPVFRERFRRESRLAARISSPHIVPIHDFGEIDGQLFIDMALIRGTDLAHVIDQTGPLPLRRAVEIVAQIADALDAAHAEGLVHRDVKPSNVLVTGLGRDFAYLADFGIVGGVRAAGATLTSAGVTVGTLDYMAPERFTDAGDRRVDVYALACVLFQMLTARRPFCADAVPALIYAHINSAPSAASAFRSGVPAALDEVVARGMAKAPEDRYSTAGQLAAAARAALAVDPVHAALHATANQHQTAAPRFRDALPQGGVNGDVDLVRRPARHRLGGTTDVSIPYGAGGAQQSSLFRLRTLIIAISGVLLTSALSGAANPHAMAINQAGIRCASPTAPAGATPAVAAQVSLEGGAGSVVISPDGCRAYALGDGFVHVIDTTSRTITASIPVGALNNSLAITPDGRRIYVTKAQTDIVPVIDTAANNVITTVRLDAEPTVMAVTPDGEHVLIASASGEISVIAVASNTVESTMFVEGLPQGLAITPDSRHVFISDDGSGKVLLLDLSTRKSTQVASIPEGTSTPDGIILDPTGNRAYVTEDVPGVVSILDATTGAVTGHITVGPFFHGIAVTPDGRRLCVANEDGTVAVIDVERAAVTSRVSVGGTPRGVVISPDGRNAYVGSNNGNDLTVVDLGT